MEMLAVEEVLKAIKQKGCSIVVHTDSKLVIGHMVWGWKAKASHLRRIIGRISARVSLMGHTVGYRKVITPNGDVMNERADELARKAAPLIC
jgi:ribonuclease HI